MKHRFLAENRGFLRVCADMAKLYGIVCLIAAGGAALVCVNRSVRTSSFELYGRVPVLVLHGLLALVVAEFIKYLLAGDEKPKWLLRNGDKVMYAYACLLLATMVRSLLTLVPLASESVDRWFTGVGLGIFSLLSMVALALMWVGLGITLGKILPILRESKTLV
jgi:hypothetical protein